VYACPPGCRVCFLAEIYGLTPREVALIALISSGTSGRVISQTLGVGMTTIRPYCARIHGKIATRRGPSIMSDTLRPDGRLLPPGCV
jgi:ATP/maltotriose-dependent transcriptional regulator MalT